MKIETWITVYERDGKELVVPTQECAVRNHWSNDRLVEIHLNDLTSVVVEGRELKRAIENALGWRYS